MLFQLTRAQVQLFHMLFVGPLIAYVGYKRAAPKEIYYVLLALGVFAMAYHGYNFFMRENYSE